MQSAVTTVDAYIAEAPVERRAALEHLRRLCRSIFVDAVEVIDYGMAAYQRDGIMQVAFASQKNHIALYGLGADILDRHEADLGNVERGKGCLRYRKPDAVDFALVERMLREARARDGSRR